MKKIHILHQKNPTQKYLLTSIIYLVKTLFTYRYSTSVLSFHLLDN